MSELIRASALTGYQDLVAHLGGMHDKLLGSVGLTPAVLAETDTLISYPKVIKLLELSADTLGCPDFGLQLSARQSLQVLGPLALLAQNATTVAEGLLAVSRYMHYYSDAIHAAIDPTEQAGIQQISLTPIVRGCPRRQQTAELLIACAYKSLRLLAGPHTTATAVLFRHASGQPARRYGAEFGCTVLFGQATNALLVSDSVLARPIEQSRPELHQLAEAYVAGIIAQRPMDTNGQVRALVDRLLPGQQCTLIHVAERLFLHPRTLQRRLANDGTTFDAILDEVRRQRAAEYLSQPRLPLSTVASQLGFAEQSAFNRAFRRWFDAAPLQKRRESLLKIGNKQH